MPKGDDSCTVKAVTGVKMKFKTTIEAVQLNWKNWSEVCDFLGSIITDANPARAVPTYSDKCGEVGSDYIELTIPGPKIVRHGDWIIKGINGEFYPCKPDIFAGTYVGDFEVLESKLQLHQRLEVLYVVDGYVATFLDRDGERIVDQAHGETIAEAIEKLEEKLEDYIR